MNILYIMMLLMKKALGMAGLNFVGNACYQEVKEGAVNVVSMSLSLGIMSMLH